MTRVFAMVSALTAVIACGTEQQPVADSRVAILGSVSHQIASRAVGDTFQISVVLPRTYQADTTRRYPVVYLLDGNALIGVAASVAWELGMSGMPEVILVGVDYPVADLDQSQGIRFRDLTPSADPAGIAAIGSAHATLGLPAPTTSGGGARFITFLTDELGPRIDSLYRTDASHRSLLGLSLGGLLTLHVLLERPDYYRNYIVLSPFLVWNNDETLARYRSIAKDRQPVQRLFVSVGLLEEDSTYRMVSNVRELEAIVATHRSLALATHFQYFPDENHNSGWPAAMSRGLRYAFQLWPPDGPRD